MMDRPTSTELVQAVRHYLETELLPALTDARQRFQTLVAAHVLGIVERELPVEERLLREEADLLGGVLERPALSPAPVDELRGSVLLANLSLCEQVRAGLFDEPERMQVVLRQLRPLVVRKLEITNPRYLGRS
jgi:Domain of unknown function (DUF6285)